MELPKVTSASRIAEPRFSKSTFICSGVIHGSPLFNRTVGFAYAGSSLIALQAYAAILALWARLMPTGEEALPTMGACAENLGLFLKEYARDLAGAGRGQEVKTECVLLGRDDHAGAVEAWQAGVKLGANDIDLDVSQIMLGDGQIVLVGSGKAEARKKLNELNPTGKPWGKEPIAMLRNQLRGDQPGTVGGGVQIASVESDGFNLNADVQAAVYGQAAFGDPYRAIRFRGFDLGKVGRVGNTFASIGGVDC